jgi:glycosyltransferase involved in cell wall biosynthesis
MNTQDSQTTKSQDEILVLETYSAHESAYDGLSGLFNSVRGVGKIVGNTADISGAKVLVCGIAPLYQHKISPLNTNVIFTTFESDQLPEEWVRAINNYQHCIVAHAAIKEVFVASGICIPITVIHNGYQRYTQKENDKVKNTFFNIGFLGIPVNRKNLIKLYEACKQLHQTLIPELHLHVHVAAFYDWLDSVPFEEMKMDRMVHWTMGKLTTEKVSSWYNHLSAYVFPSSGEGWSYTPRESLYLGIPAIISDIPVHQDLVETGFYKRIKTSGKIPADFNGVVHGCWDNIEVDDIRDAIADVYQHHQHFQALAKQGAEWIKDQWRNDDIAKEIIDLIKTL